jgi:ribokinase
MDLVIRTQHLPLPGQTRMARSLQQVSGGKGANQAVAAARLGADVGMLGCVGSDGFAATLQQNLAHEKINTRWVRKVPGPSGVAFVAVDDAGENSIVVVPGANGQMHPARIDESIDAIAWADWVVLQLEIPIDTVKHVIALARHAGKRIVLNPAPAPQQFDAELFHVDLLCPNQSEAESILGGTLTSVDDARAAAIALRQRGAKQVVITLGDQGAIASDSTNDTTIWIPPVAVDVVDTTAAGDAFIGAMVTKLASGNSLQEAATYAAAAAAHAVTIPGAQPSLPTHDDVLSILNLSLS